MKKLCALAASAALVIPTIPHVASAQGVYGAPGACGVTAVQTGLGANMVVDSTTGNLCTNAPGSTGTPAIVQGNQSNAAGGTIGGNNVGVMGYSYYWNGAAWAQWTGAVTISAGSALIGKFGIDQTTPGNTNGVQTLSGSTTVVTGTVTTVGVSSAALSAALSYATATTPQVIVTHSGSTTIKVSAVDFVSAGTTNVTFEYGTGSTCGTGTTVLTGAYPLTAQAGLSKGNGGSAFWIVPANNDLCWVLSAAIQVSGSVSYAQ